MFLFLSACTPIPPVEGTPPPGDTGSPASVVTPTPTEVPGTPSVLQFAGAPPKNLVVLSLDTGRRDHVGRYGIAGNTPNLETIFDQGVVLDDHRSCSSWTGPSMLCVVTGLTPLALDWFPWTADDAVSDYRGDLPTLASELQIQKGFRTSLVTASGVMGPFLDIGRGFQTVRFLDLAPAATVVDSALEEAQGLAGASDPFYLHVHFMDPHRPYCPPDEYVDSACYSGGLPICLSFEELSLQYEKQTKEWQAEFLSDTLEVYDGEFDYWDVELGRLWDGLDGIGALDDTLVVFVTDHGEQFYEHGEWGHGNTLHAEENRAVAAFWAKDIVPARWGEPTVHEDVGTTLFDLFGLAPPQELSGMVVGTAPAERPVRGMLYWGGGGRAQLSVLVGVHQLTYDFSGEKHLWDYSLDPTGLTDFYDPADPNVLTLWGPMGDYVAEVLDQWPSSAPAVSAGP